VDLATIGQPAHSLVPQEILTASNGLARFRDSLRGDIVKKEGEASRSASQQEVALFGSPDSLARS